MEVFHRYYLTFANMDFLTAVILVLGLVCVIAEISQPGFVALGVSGSILLVVGVLLRLFSLSKGEELFAVMFSLIATIMIIILISFVIIVRLLRYTWLKYMPDVSDESREETDKRYSDLRGVEGVSTSSLRPVGTAVLCGAEYTVLAEGFFINRGEKIKVSKIENGNIIVRKIK